MTAYDYSTVAATAKRLIERFGRTCTFIKLDRTTVDDAAKSWRGTATPRAIPAASISAIATFVSATSAKDFGFSAEAQEEIKKAGQMCIVAHSSVATSLTDFDEIQDGSQVWRITYISMLKPGGTPLLYGMAVKQ